MVSIIAFFILIPCVYYLCPDFFSLVDTSKASSVGAAMTSVAATMLGFMLAALSVLVSISGIDYVKNLMIGGHYKDLLKNLFFGCLGILLLLIFSLILLFGNGFNSFVSSIYISLLISCVFMLVEVGHKFWLVLKLISNS